MRVVDSSNENAEEEKLTETSDGTNGGRITCWSPMYIDFNRVAEANKHVLRCTALMDYQKEVKWFYLMLLLVSKPYLNFFVGFRYWY